MGRSDLYLKLEICKKIVGFFVLFICINISVMAMCYGMLIAGFICQMINAWPNSLLLNYPYKEQIKDIFPSILLASFMGLCVYSINLLDYSNVVSLILQLLVGVSVYVCGSILFKMESFFYLKNILFEYISGKKKCKN